MNHESRIKDRKVKGFTLLETLIVIGVIAVISAILIYVLNPGETLRKARDSQRLSDLKTLNRAIAFLITTKTNFQGEDLCPLGKWVDSPNLYLSFPKTSPGVEIDKDTCPVITPPPGSPLSSYDGWGQVTNENLYFINGNGWVPVDFRDISGGSPISRLPVDPVNSLNIPKDIEGDNCPDDDDLIYRYTCFRSNLTFEIDAKLESKEFTVSDNKAKKDGGTNSVRYELGTALNLLP